MSTAGGCLCPVFSKVLLKVFGCTAQICGVIPAVPSPAALADALPGCPPLSRPFGDLGRF